MRFIDSGCVSIMSIVGLCAKDQPVSLMSRTGDGGELLVASAREIHESIRKMDQIFCSVGAFFVARQSRGRELRSVPASGSRPHAELEAAASRRSESKLLPSDKPEPIASMRARSMFCDRVSDARWITLVGTCARRACRQLAEALGQREQHHAGVGGPGCRC